MLQSRVLIPFSAMVSVFLTCGCSEAPAVSLSCSILTSSKVTMEALIIIAPKGNTAKLVWLPKKAGDPAWHIRGHLDDRFFSGIVDGDLAIKVSIDRTTGGLEMVDSTEPSRRYVGKCEGSKQVF